MLEASTTGNLEQVQQLLAKGVNIEAMDVDGTYILKLDKIISVLAVLSF